MFDLQWTRAFPRTAFALGTSRLDSSILSLLLSYDIPVLLWLASSLHIFEMLRDLPRRTNAVQACIRINNPHLQRSSSLRADRWLAYMISGESGSLHHLERCREHQHKCNASPCKDEYHHALSMASPSRLTHRKLVNVQYQRRLSLQRVAYRFVEEYRTHPFLGKLEGIKAK